MNKLLLLTSLFLFLSCSKNEEFVNDNTEEIPEQPEESKTLNFENHKIEFTPNELSKYININSNIDYKYKTIGNETSWLSYSIDNNKLHITTTPNNNNDEKKAKIIIYNDIESLYDTLEVVQPINKERLVLIQIYKSLNGKEWTNQENWCTDKPLNEWEGVMANGDMGVFRLWLSHDAYISGEIPECIGDLIDLNNISFEYSNVKGVIPETIGNLKKLERITLSNCKLEGNIPSSIKNCTELEYVDMSDNSLTGEIPECFFQCKKLSYLTLDNNKFNKFEIKNTPISNELHTLLIQNNNIQSPIPEKLFDCKSLRFLHANDNEITGHIPSSIKKALNLEVLYLQNNKINGELPSELDNDSNLGNLNLSNNKISGTIPKCYSTLEKLQFFNISNNYIDIKNCEYIESNPNYNNWKLIPQNNIK